MQHLYECLNKDITYNPVQADQYIQLDEPELPDFLLHIDEEEDPMPCFAMTNPYEALLMHDPDRLCVRVSLICCTPSNLLNGCDGTRNKH